MPSDGTHDPSASRTAAVSGPVNEVLTGRGPLTGAFDDTLGGHLLDRSHTVAPFNLGPMIVEELVAAGARDIAIWVQDYDQHLLHPLPLPDQPDAAVVDEVRAYARRLAGHIAHCSSPRGCTPMTTAASGGART